HLAAAPSGAIVHEWRLAGSLSRHSCAIARVGNQEIRKSGSGELKVLVRIVGLGGGLRERGGTVRARARCDAGARTRVRCDAGARIADRRYAHESYGRIDVWLLQTAQASSVSA